MTGSLLSPLGEGEPSRRHDARLLSGAAFGASSARMFTISSTSPASANTPSMLAACSVVNGAAVRDHFCVITTRLSSR
jgi:hypothetical protein